MPPGFACTADDEVACISAARSVIVDMGCQSLEYTVYSWVLVLAVIACCIRLFFLVKIVLAISTASLQFFLIIMTFPHVYPREESSRM